MYKQRLVNAVGAVCISALVLGGCAFVEQSLSSTFHETKGLKYLEAGDFPKAEEQLKLAVSMAAREPANRTGNVGRIEYELGSLYRKQSQNADAEEAYKRSLIVFSENAKLVTDPDRKYWAQCLNDYAQLLRATDRAGEADVRERQARKILGVAEEPAAPNISKPAANSGSEPAGHGATGPTAKEGTEPAAPHVPVPGEHGSNQPAAQSVTRRAVKDGTEPAAPNVTSHAAKSGALPTGSGGGSSATQPGSH